MHNLERNSIKSTHFDQAKCMSRQQEAYPTANRNQININTREKKRGKFASSRTIKLESIYQYNQTRQKCIKMVQQFSNLTSYIR